MYRLLRADFARLKKNKAFGLCISAVFLTAVINALNLYRQVKVTDGMIGDALDTYYFEFLPMLGIFSAIVISLFFGTEYSDGTMRNKLIVGSTRTNIYLSSAVTSAAVSAAVTFAWFIGGLMGVPLLGMWMMPLSDVLLYILTGVFASVALSAIFTFISMNCSRKAEGAVIAILSSLLLLILASVIYNMLQEPEMTREMVVTANGMELTDPHLNPDYVGGALRTVLTALLHLLPTGQQILIANLELVQPLQHVCYAIGLTIAVTVCGMLVYRKKDLK